MKYGELSFNAAKEINKDIVYKTNYYVYAGILKDYSSWVKQTMLYRPKVFLKILKEWKKEDKNNDFISEFREIIKNKEMILQLEKYYIIRFKYLPEGVKLYMEIYELLNYYKNS